MLSWLADLTGADSGLIQKLWLSALAIAIVLVLRVVVLRAALKRNGDVRIRYRWHKASGYITLAIIALIMARIWLDALSNLMTLVGLVSAGLAIALQSLIVALAGWLFILIRKPFLVGDRIQIQDIIGDVVDQSALQFTLLEVGNWVHADQSTGRLVHMPNSLVFSVPVANYSRPFPFIWVETPVLVTFESNWQTAKALLAEIVTRVTRDEVDEAERHLDENRSGYLIEQGTLTPIVYTSVEDSGVLLTLRYLVGPRRRRMVAERIWEEILVALAARNDIDFAYPTQRFYDNKSEGKPDARAND